MAKSANAAQATTAAPTKVGIVLVHGIGEQRRFEHLNGHIRGIIEAWREAGHGVSVEIVEGAGASFQADQATWATGPGPTIKVVVKDQTDGKTYEVGVHEVWWADINEPYSVVKQLRFWWWGLTVWNFPEKMSSNTGLGHRMHTLEPSRRTRLAARAKILLVSNLLLLTTLSFTIGFGLLKRVFGVEAPGEVRVLVNFLSSIKLYNQKKRRGLGFPGVNADPLDNMGEPPRTAIRRRIVTALADVACQGYDQWFVMAHSLGSVVAFNGLMEPAYVLANYLDETRWKALVTHRFAGVPQGGPHPSPGKTTPPRPAWVDAGFVVDRPALFSKFAGLVTYGSPIGKFGAIWPARISVCREPAFTPGTPWFNIYDPLDPVSGVGRNFNGVNVSFGGWSCSPTKVDIGYASDSILLKAHITYLRGAQKGSLSRALGDLFLKKAWPGLDKLQGRFFGTDTPRFRRRRNASLAWWAAAYAVIVTSTTWLILAAVSSTRERMACPTSPAPTCVPESWTDRLGGFLQGLLAWPADHWRAILLTAVVGLVISLVVGGVTRLLPIYAREEDDPNSRKAKRLRAAMASAAEAPPEIERSAGDTLTPVEPVLIVGRA